MIAAVQHPSLFAGIVLIEPPILPFYISWLMTLMKWLGLISRNPWAKRARRRVRTFQGKQAAFERFASGRGIFKKWSPEFIDAYLECGLLEKDSQTAVLRCDPELEAQIFESIPADIWRYTHKITCPVLLIRGAVSDAFRPSAAKRLMSKMTDCRLETIPETGHFPPMEKPAACADAISEFAEGCLPPLEVCRGPLE